MITFLDEETEASGLKQWIQIKSEQADVVLFHLGVGGPIDFINPEDHKRNVAYAVWGDQLDDILKLAALGAKASWMGKATDPLVIFPGGGKEHLWMDLIQDNGAVTIYAGHYPSGESQGKSRTFSYTLTSQEFLEVAEEISKLRKYSNG